MTFWRFGYPMKVEKLSEGELPNTCLELSMEIQFSKTLIYTVLFLSDVIGIFCDIDPLFWSQESHNPFKWRHLSTAPLHWATFPLVCRTIEIYERGYNANMTRTQALFVLINYDWINTSKVNLSRKNFKRLVNTIWGSSQQRFSCTNFTHKSSSAGN